MAIVNMETGVTLDMPNKFALIAIVTSFSDRHPRICKWFQEYNRCKFTTFCHFKHVKIDSIENLMVKIEENTNKLSELDKKLEQIEKEEIVIQKKLEAHEDQIEKKLKAFENRLVEMSKQMEEKNNKITALENILKKTSDKLENTKKAKDIKFKCNMCDFQSGSQSGLKTHISRKHTNYPENEDSFKCEICEDVYIKKEYSKDHMLTHSY